MKSPRFLEKQEFCGRLEEECDGATKNDEGRVDFVEKIGIWRCERGVRLSVNPYRATKNDEGRVDFVEKNGIWGREEGVRSSVNPYTTDAMKAVLSHSKRL